MAMLNNQRVYLVGTSNLCNGSYHLVICLH
jgi:hypothetical protein